MCHTWEGAGEFDECRDGALVAQSERPSDRVSKIRFEGEPLLFFGGRHVFQLNFAVTPQATQRYLHNNNYI